MAEIRITQKGSEWVQKTLKEHNIDPKILDALGAEIAKRLEQYRKAPLETIIDTVNGREAAEEVANQLLRELGLI